MLILMSITTIHAVDLDNNDLQELHELEDKMSMEMYGVSYDELAQENPFEGIYMEMLIEQKKANVELAVQNYLFIHGGVN